VPKQPYNFSKKQPYHFSKKWCKMFGSTFSKGGKGGKRWI